MGSVNKVILVGNLGSDPELKYPGQGQRALCTFSVATSEKWKDKKTGQMQEKTEWHRVSVWGDHAENCSKYLAKGRSVYVDGKLQTRKYEKDGQTHYATDVVANQVVFLGGGQGGRRGGNEEYNQDHGRPASTGRGRSAPSPDADEPKDSGPPSDDDIPF